MNHAEMNSAIDKYTLKYTNTLFKSLESVSVFFVFTKFIFKINAGFFYPEKSIRFQKNNIY